MQLVLSSNRIIAHGENFLSMGGVVINTVTGAKYENATIAECNGCPSDIDKVGYEYHAGVFVPCAPFGVGNNNGYFMEVCETCATPRSSGIPIKGGLKAENMHSSFKPSQIGGMDIALLWQSARDYDFYSQTITLSSYDWDFLFIVTEGYTGVISARTTEQYISYAQYYAGNNPHIYLHTRSVTVSSTKRNITFGEGYRVTIFTGGDTEVQNAPSVLIPFKIYGVKI